MIRDHQKRYRDRWLKNGENSHRLNWIQKLLHQQKNLDFAQLLMNLFVAKSKMTFYQLLMCIH